MEQLTLSEVPVSPVLAQLRLDAPNEASRRRWQRPAPIGTTMSLIAVNVAVWAAIDDSRSCD